MMLRIWRKRKISIPARFWLACGLWFAIPGLAVLWFDRAEVKLWLIPMFAFWVVIALILSLKYNDARQSSSRLWWMILVILFPVLVGSSNFMLAVWPNYALESLEIGKARYAIERMNPEDLIVSSGFDWTIYVSYFCRECRTVNAISIAQSFSIQEQDKVKTILWENIYHTWEQGGRVYALEYLGMSQHATWNWDTWITPYTGLVYEDFTEFEMIVAWRFEDEIVWEIIPKP